MAGRFRRDRAQVDVWPGWVDALSSLLMVLIFLLMVFLVSQFYLTSALTGRDEEVSDLKGEIADLEDKLTTESDAGRDLGGRVERLTADLDSTVAERDTLATQVAELTQANADLTRRLREAQESIASLASGTDDRASQLAEADRMLQTSQADLDNRLRELARLQSELETLEATRQDLELQVATLGLALEASKKEAAEAGTKAELSEQQIRDLYDMVADKDARIAALTTALAKSGDDIATREAQITALGAQLAEATEQVATLQADVRLTADDRDRVMAELAELRDRSAELEAKLREPDETTVLLQAQLDTKTSEAAELQRTVDDMTTALAQNREALSDAEAKAGDLDNQIASLKEELDRVQAALQSSESSVSDKEVEISNLESRLNQALIRTVDELNQSRSEFFGRLRSVLGDRPGVRIVGDRFIFQSEVLFAIGSADLQEGGRQQLAAFAQTLKDIAAQFPPDVDWVLRIDGHTDRQQMGPGARFASNWELSTERALSVLYFLVQQGVPEDRLAAAGFGEFQPLDPADTPEAYARNRRIELRLDARGETGSEPAPEPAPGAPAAVEPAPTPPAPAPSDAAQAGDGALPATSNTNP